MRKFSDKSDFKKQLYLLICCLLSLYYNWKLETELGIHHAIHL